VEELGDDLFTVPQSLRLATVNLGTRMTVVRVGTDLLLHSPVRIDDTIAGELDSLGRVRWLLAPCTYHHLFVARAKDRWKDAVVLGVPGLSRKRPDLSLDGLLPAATPAEWSGAIEARMIEGMPGLNEVALLHRPTKTLVLTDFMFHLPSVEGLFGRTLLRLADSYGPPRQSRLLRFLVKDKAALRASRDAILAWDFDRISVCHRDLIPTGGKDAFARATAWLG
jgi:hypothetical protein